jgi:hypothetical protein
MRGVTTIAFSAWVAAAGFACGGRRPIEIQPGSSEQIPDSLYVHIRNDHFSDARIHAVYLGGARYSLGGVVGKSVGELTTVVWRPRPLVFEIRLIGPSEVYLSDELLPAPGDVIGLTIPPNIRSSAFFHRR